MANNITELTRADTESALIDRMYEDTIEDLRGTIQVKFGSVANFCRHCEEQGLAKPEETNLSRIFSKNSSRSMSVGLYIRILIGLGLADQDAIIGETMELNLPLRLYLKIDHNIVMRSFNLFSYI